MPSIISTCEFLSATHYCFKVCITTYPVAYFIGFFGETQGRSQKSRLSAFTVMAVQSRTAMCYGSTKTWYSFNACTMYLTTGSEHYSLVCFYVVFAAVILLGQPATGKSTVLNTVVSVLNAEQGNSVAIKLSKVYPKAVDNLYELFGCVNPTTGDWEDGVFTSIFRKAHQVGTGNVW